MPRFVVSKNQYSKKLNELDNLQNKRQRIFYKPLFNYPSYTHKIKPSVVIYPNIQCINNIICFTKSSNRFSQISVTKKQ